MRSQGGCCAGEIRVEDGKTMKVDGRHFRSIWLEDDGWSVGAIDQRRLPHEFVIARLRTCEDAAYARADEIAEEDVVINQGIAKCGLDLIAKIAATKARGEHVNVLTHCNAGWLATVDWGTATAPIYLAHEEGHPVHVWVDETRPRNQGASLTAWELGHHGVPHTVITDNTGGQ